MDDRDLRLRTLELTIDRYNKSGQLPSPEDIITEATKFESYLRSPAN